MRETRSHSIGNQLIVAALFAIAGLGLLTFFVLFARPPERQHRAAFQRGYSETQLVERLTAKGLEGRVAQIAEASARQGERQVGRQSGSPGFYRTEALIAAAFRESGLDVQTQELQVVVPETEVCEILGEDGKPLPDVMLYPFAPCGIMPVALPPEGIAAKLVQTDSADLALLNGENPKDSIVLTYVDAATGWQALAGAGVRAVIVREDDVAKALENDPDAAAPWNTLVPAADMPYPRFLARGPIEQFKGQRVTIRCRVVWQTKKVRNVLGVLRGTGASREALVLTSFYDSNSLVPDLAPGAEQSLSLAALLEYAQALAPYKGQLGRDVIFVATAGHAQAVAGVSRLMEGVEQFRQDRRGFVPLDRQRAEEAGRIEYANRALAICDDMASASITNESYYLERVTKDDDFRRWFEACLKIVAGEVNLDRRERVLAAKLAYFRADRPVFRDGFDANNATDEERARPENTHPLLRAYVQTQVEDNESGNMMSLPLWKMAAKPSFVTWRYQDMARRYFTELRAYHQQCVKELDDTLAVQKLFGNYERTLTLNLELYSGGRGKKKGKGKDLALMVGIDRPGTAVEPQVSDLANAIMEHMPVTKGSPQFQILQWGSRDTAGTGGGNKERIILIGGKQTELESAVWYRCGRLAFTAVSPDYYPPKASTPEDVWEALPLASVKQQVPVLGRAILSLAAGQVRFKTIQEDRGISIMTVQGTLFGSAGTASVVPSHRMWPRTFLKAYQEKIKDLTSYTARGINVAPILPTNPYGEFCREFTFDVATKGGAATVLAARFDAQGRIAFINEIATGNRAVFRSKIPGEELAAAGANPPIPITLSMFRCTPVTVYDQINPQTMKRFKNLAYVDRATLSTPAKTHFREYMAFLEPYITFYVGLADGAADNTALLTDRAFMLNVDPKKPITAAESEIYGAGYLAADNDTVTTPGFDVAESMLRTADKRLKLQERYGMADELMLSFHRQAREWLTEARTKWEQKDPAEALNAAGTSEAYTINNYPVIRSRISQAVVGILWYLALLVPFVFFAEKLFFGFADIRRQLLASGIIFLVVFLLLRLFHPAFQMVRSSLMILLGFLMFMLSVLVTVMVSGKFKQNLKDLRRKEGQVEGADISRGGVVGTAFMLGLNNMRRRKVRTGLTCATLVLITFVMICFTSVSTDLVNVEQQTGRSTWNGIMIRDQNFRSLDANEIGNLQQLYGARYPVTVHKWLMGNVKGGQNTEVIVDREYTVGDNKVVKRGRASAAIEMGWNEPLFTGVDRYLVTKRGWFPRPPQTRQERLDAMKAGDKAKLLIILPDVIARDLGIRPEDVDQGSPVVAIGGVEYEVQGIFDSVELAKCMGLDGQSILPYDMNAIQNFGTASDGTPLVPPDTPRLQASQVVLVNTLPTKVPGAVKVLASCLILFPKDAYRVKPDGPQFPAPDYKAQRRVVLGYLERIAQPAYYAIDGVAYYGSRLRERSFSGLLELLVPILIAALTVFSTMRGSVYERRSEIYVYNAVGIAPNHVFFMFMAEACVYAVMGAVLGYILSQGTGRLLTALNLTGGMKMDYSSIETIYASLAIMASVLLSTLLPARDAAKLASPSDTASWTIPQAEGDDMVFNLPFTFTPHDRVAVISYFHRWLDANGLGSSGPFFCAPPEPQLEMHKRANTDEEELVPSVGSTIWLKPYDLGVSQRMQISLPTDHETGEYVARIKLTRLSGNAASWNRTLGPFLGVLRKQFLNWRATTDSDRREMFEEANRILSERVEKETRHA